MRLIVFPLFLVSVLIMIWFFFLPVSSQFIEKSSVQTNLTDGVLKVIAVGDISCPDLPATSKQCQQQATATLAASLKPDYFLVLGDLQYGGGLLRDFQTFYDRSWGVWKNQTWPVIGNHEYERDATAAGYFDYFNGEGNFAGSAGDRDKGYYAIDKAGWKIIILNSNCWAIGGCDSNSPQGKWLKDQLETTSSKCQLIAFHHPRYSSGQHGINQFVRPFWEIAFDNGVDLVLSGHDHVFERFAPQDGNGQFSDRGVRQFVVGTGGRNLYQFVNILPNSEKRINDQFGVLSLNLLPFGYSWQFINTDQKILDSGEAVCQSN